MRAVTRRSQLHMRFDLNYGVGMRNILIGSIVVLFVSNSLHAAEVLQYEDSHTLSGEYGFKASGKCPTENILDAQEEWHAEGPVRFMGQNSRFTTYFYGPNGTYRTSLQLEDSKSVGFWARIVCGERGWDDQLKSKSWAGEFMPKELTEAEEQQRSVAKRQRAAEEKRLLARFRTGIKVESETNCGPVIEVRGNLVKVYSVVKDYGNEHWIKRNELYPVGQACWFKEGQYVGINPLD